MLATPGQSAIPSILWLTTKAEIASAIRQAATEGVKRKYYRNHIVEGLWGDADADVVWTFVYLSADDRARRHWRCRSLWIREDLAEEFWPAGFDGENIGGLIKVDWNSNYTALAQLANQHTLQKEDYLTQVVPLIDELEQLLAVVETGLERLSTRELGEAEFMSSTRAARNRVHDIYMHSLRMSLAPYECSEMDGKFTEFIALIDNMVILYSEPSMQARSKKDRLAQGLRYRDHSRETLNHLRYELSKVQ